MLQKFYSKISNSDTCVVISQKSNSPVKDCLMFSQVLLVFQEVFYLQASQAWRLLL